MKSGIRLGFRRREWLVLGAILVLGAALRLLYLHEISAWPDFSYPILDAAYHDFWARGLARGEWATLEDFTPEEIVRRPFFRPPGYPYFLAAVYRVFGHGYLAPRLIQFGLGLVSCVLIYLAARRWVGPPPALIAAFFSAVYWVFIYFEGELLDPALSIFSLLVFVNLVMTWKKKLNTAYSCLSGVALGLFALVRANALLLIPAVILWMVWVLARRRLRGRSLVTAASFLLGSAVVILPVTARNYLVSGEFVLIASNAGSSLLVGNNDRADGTTHYLPGWGYFDSPFDHPATLRALERQLGRPIGAAAASAYYTRQALNWIRAHPLDFALLTLRKTALFWGPAEVTNNKEIHYSRLYSKVLKAIPGGFSLVLALFLTGTAILILDRRTSIRHRGKNRIKIAADRESGVLFILLILVYFLSMLPAAAADRYRLPVVPLMLVVSSAGVWRGIEWLVADRKKALIYFLSTAATYLVVSRELTGYRPSEAKWYFDRAVALDRSGRHKETEESYRLALEREPLYGPALNNLASILLHRGELEEAIGYFRLFASLRPEMARAHSNLALALGRKGEVDEALESFQRALDIDPNDQQVWGSLGAFHFHRGEFKEAASAYERKVELCPHSGQARFFLARALWELGMKEEAEKNFRRAVELEPGRAEFYINLANVQAAGGDLSGAEENYRRALRIDPSSGLARYNLGVTLEKRGGKEEAETEYRLALKADPGLVSAHYNLALILLEKGDKPEARRHFEEAARLRPGYPPALRALERLEEEGK